MRVQQEDLFDEVQLCEDIKNRLNQLHDDLLKDTEYKFRFYKVNVKYRCFSQKNIEILVFLIVFLSLSIQTYYQIDSWIMLDIDQKLIYDTQIPWGLVYILTSLPILLIQGADYNNQSQAEKEIIQLSNDYKYIKQLNSDIPDLKLNYDIKDIHPFNLKYISLVALLIIIFFQDGFNSCINQLVSLQYLSEFHKVTLVFLSKHYFSISRVDISYSKVWQIRSIDQNWGNFQGTLTKQIKLTNKILQEDGNQLRIILSRKLLLCYQTIKLIFIGFISALFAYSFQKSWIDKYYQNNLDIGLHIVSLGAIIYIIYFCDYYISQDIQFLIMNIQALKRMKKSSEQYCNNIQAKHKKHQKVLTNIYLEKKRYKIILFLIQSFFLKYSKREESFLNIFSVNYIINIDSIAINRFFQNCDKNSYLRISNYRWFSYPKQYKSFNQFYLFMLNIKDKYIKQSKDYDDKQVTQVIHRELSQNFFKLYYEDGFQLQFMESNLAFKVRVLVLLLELFYIILIIYDKINKWKSMSNESIYINNICPWGVIFLIFSIFIMLLQGVGRSEENKIFQLYLYQRNNYLKLQSLRISEWNDELVSQIQVFNYLQETILVVALLVVSFFSQYFYEVLQNIVAFEFLFYLDEHALGTYFRHLYRFENLQKRWQNIKKIVYIDDQKLENIYRFVWKIRKIQ